MQGEWNLTDQANFRTDFGNIASYTYYVVTNAHVITSEESGEHRVYAYLGHQNTEVLAEVLGCDEKWTQL